MKDVKHLLIEYCDPNNHADAITLTYKLRKHPVVAKWIDRVNLAQEKYSIDDPARFYGFGSVEDQQKLSLELLNDCILTINSFEHIIDRSISRVDDQDTLNYLHHIFEVYHGLLDQQTHELWQRAPNNVRRALADLNILVHRCESVYRGAKPRHVVTWYGLPKDVLLDAEDYCWFEDGVKFGTVYLNYVEIGKTLEDFAHDNDQYIANEAYQPFQHYSADFNVKFWTDSDRQIEKNRSIIKAYLDSHADFFKDKNTVCGNIPLADLVNYDADNVLADLEKHQYVKAVSFI
jgi:hypothetical protein